MNKRYVYRKHEKYVHYIIIGIMVLSIGVMWLMASILRGSMESELAIEVQRIAIAATIFLLMQIAVLLLTAKEFSKKYIMLTDEYVLYCKGKKEKKIHIKDIVKVELITRKYLGGRMKLKTGNRCIRVSFSIESIGEFVRELKGLLESNGRDDLFDINTLYSFYKSAEYSDQSWHRIYEMFFKLIMLILFNIIMGAVLCYFLNANIVQWMLILYISAAGPLIAYAVAEIPIDRKVFKEVQKDSFFFPARDRVLEKRIYKLITLTYICIFPIISFLIINN